MRTLTAAAMGLTMMLGVANHAAAKNGLPPVQPPGGCAKAINLVASPAGQAIAAQGRARVRAFFNNGVFVQDFVVEVGALVPNGTVFMVFANGLPAGTITIIAGRGVLDVNNQPPNVLPAGTDPVCAIGPVIVTNGAGATILSGTF